MALDYNSSAEDAILYCDGPGRDGCEGQIELSGSFKSVIEQVKVMGWKAFNEGGEWKHHCPACKEGA